MPHRFSDILSDYQQESHRSQRSVALDAGLDPARYSRILRGEAEPASRAQVVALAKALDLAPVERDRLVAAAGYLPPGFDSIGVDDPAVLALVAALADETLSSAARARLRATIITLCGHWGHEPSA